MSEKVEHSNITIGKYSGFTTKEVENLTKVSARKVRWWDKLDLVKPSVHYKKRSKRFYSLRDVICILVINELRQNDISLQKIKKCVEGARQAGIEDSLAKLRIAFLGNSIFFKENGKYYDPITGQYAFESVLKLIRPQIEPQPFSRIEQEVIRANKYYEKKVAGL